MKKLLFFFSILNVTSATLPAQCEKVFQYADSTFQVGSIRYLDFRFDYNGGFLIKDSIALVELDKLSEFIRSHQNLRFDLECHTDRRGSQQYLLRFSQGRIERLAALLVQEYSVNSMQINPIGYGKSKPLIDPIYRKQLNLKLKDVNTQESVHYLNRRIILKIQEIIN